MPVSVALAGPVGAGKTTIFMALTHGRGKDGVGMVDVGDERLDRLAEAVHPKKVVPAQVRLVDAPPGSRAQRVAVAREADVVVEIARGFGLEPQPAKDFEEVDLDLVLADLTTVERRLEQVDKEARVGKRAPGPEGEALRAAKHQLDAGRPLRELELEPAQAEALAPLFLVSRKPVVRVINVADDTAAGDGSGAQIVNAQLELELAQLEPEEAQEYRRSYGLEGQGLETIARAIWSAGGLITYFTAGEPEVRAWAVEKDAPAPVAAGVIHSDFEKHFIRAEVTSVDELVTAGSMEALRAAGRLRVEGRDYRVKDGDVVFFRIGK